MEAMNSDEDEDQNEARQESPQFSGMNRRYGSNLDLTGAAIEDTSHPALHHTPGEYHPVPAPSIELPNQDAEYVSHIALDIGGSLIKLIYFSPDPPAETAMGSASVSSDDGSARPAAEVGSAPAAVTATDTASIAVDTAVEGQEMHAPSSFPADASATADAGGTALPLPSRADGPAYQAANKERIVHSSAGGGAGGGRTSMNGHNGRGGRLHFVKFESSRVEDVIDFIEAKGLHRHLGKNGQKGMRIMATGGGAYKYADIFKERLGVVLEKEDEMNCLVSGTNFLLKAILHEAFTFEAGTGTTFVPTNEDSDLYPYLLVNIGSGVSMVQVTGDNEYERVSGSSLGGGTFWGLCRLLTGRKDFDEMLELSVQGNNAAVDMLVGDIYGGRDYNAIGLSADTIASSFGKVVSQDKELSDYSPADIALALCRMVAYNIGQLAYLNAMRYKIKRIFFGGFFIRGHPYTMDTISYSIRFWSKGEMAAMFLRHEGFLGAVGAFLKVHPMGPTADQSSTSGQPRKVQVRARFVERFSMGAPFAGGDVVGPAIRDVAEKVNWVEKFLALGVSADPSTSRPAAADSSITAAMIPAPDTPDGAADVSAFISSAKAGTSSGPLPSVTEAAEPAEHRGAGQSHGRSSGLNSPTYGAFAASTSAAALEASSASAASSERGSLLSNLSLGGGGGGGSSRHRPTSSFALGGGGGGNSSSTGGTPSFNSPTTSMTNLAAAAALGGGRSGSGNTAPGLMSGSNGSASTTQQQQQQLQMLQASWQSSQPLSSTTSAPTSVHRTTSLSDQHFSRDQLRMSLHVGVLHYSPTLEPFPLLADPSAYEPNTFDINATEEELHWWLGTLEGNIPTTVAKAIASEGGGDLPRRRAAAFGRAFAAHMQKLRAEPRAYGRLGLAQLLEMREDCLREFGFNDAYRLDKERETAAALQVLPDLLMDLDAQPDPRERLLLLVEGVLAANIFDRGSSACVALYQDNTIIAIYLAARQRLSKRPWAVDQFDDFAAAVLGERKGRGSNTISHGVGHAVAHTLSNDSGSNAVEDVEVPAGASHKASSDSPAPRLEPAEPAAAMGMQKSAPESAAEASKVAPPYRRVMMFVDNSGADIVLGMLPLARELLRMGCEVVLCANSYPAINDITAPELRSLLSAAAVHCPILGTARAAALEVERRCDGRVPPFPGARAPRTSTSSTTPQPDDQQMPLAPMSTATSAPASSGGSSGVSSSSTLPSSATYSSIPHYTYPIGPKLYVVANGHGSPCLDLRRVPDLLAQACVGVDLLVIEGMGRAIHTNLKARFRCDVLRLAMIKTERLAKQLFGGSLYDCVCTYTAGGQDVWLGDNKVGAGEPVHLPQPLLQTADAEIDIASRS